MPLGAGGAAAAGGVVSVAVLPIWEEAHHMVVWSCWDAASPIPAGLMHVTAAVVPNAPGEPFSHKVDLAMPELHADDSSTGIHLAAGPRGAASVFAACGGEIVALYDICRSAAPEAGEAPWAGGGAQWPHTDELWAGGGAAWQASWDHTPADSAWAGWARRDLGQAAPAPAAIVADAPTEEEEQEEERRRRRQQRRQQEGGADGEGEEGEEEDAEVSAGMEALALAGAVPPPPSGQSSHLSPRRLISYGPEWGLLAAAVGSRQEVRARLPPLRPCACRRAWRPGEGG